MNKRAPLFPSAFLLLGFLAVVFPSNPTVGKAGEPHPDMASSVEEADLIVVAQVIGLIDPKPAARTRKHREAHWIRVERTLKGADETGQRLRVRPNPLPWEDGESYILFLKWLGGDWVEAVAQDLLEATDTRIAAVAKEVAGQGEGVRPKRALWMRYSGGWDSGVLSEFSVTVDGHFEWSKRLAPYTGTPAEYEQRVGELPDDALASLIRQVAEAELGPAMDDAGEVSFRWLDSKGEAQIKGYLAPHVPPALDLLRSIEALSRSHGQTTSCKEQ